MNLLKRAWQYLAKTNKKKKTEDLAEKYAHFQRLLHANNQVLALMADMEEKLSGDYLFDFQYIRSSVNELCQETSTLVASLNSMGGWRYQDLSQALLRICSEVEKALHFKREIPVAPLVLPLEAITLEGNLVEVVGGKNANLGEVKNRVGLPVPHGFAVTSYAYKVFLEHNQLAARITELLGWWRLEDLDSLARVSEELKEIVQAAQVPPELEEALNRAYERLAEQEHNRPLLAMRSSAVGEDHTFTFAGQYETYLNVPPAEMAARYKDIVASLFTPRALFYYKNKGFREEEMAMGVAVMPMIRARASGVLFTRHPEMADQEVALINAVWGLGRYAVTGRVNPDQYVVPYRGGPEVVEKTIPAKEVMLVNTPGGGVAEVPVPPEMVQAPCLNDREIGQLMEWAAILEGHYGKPQDVEWTLDEDGRLWLLQSRPLQVSVKKARAGRPRTLKQYTVLLDQGTVACRGVGAGPVVLVRRQEDLKNFPEGGVLVARHTSPRYVTVMPQAAAIITDAGSPTGHMALLAREFRIPTIVNTGIATQVLQPGQEVTVDADYNNIYAGIVPELLESQEAKRNDLAETPVFQTLKEVVRKVVPLNLLNPQEETFTPEHCHTVHDIVRYAHEMSMREMFKLGEGEVVNEGEALELESNLPFQVSILDLGGGVKKGLRRRVKSQQILSLPFKAFWEGVTAMRWPQTKPAGVQGLASVFVNTEAEVAQGAAPYRDRSFVILSKNYMNFSIRLGYHLSMVEAYVGDQINDNFINFHFQGGGSTSERRERRTRLIADIIDHLDLHCEWKGDHLEARVAKYPPQEMAQRLSLLGKLTVYTKQLDMVLFSEGIVDWYIKDFLQEHAGVKN
ncbi:MAG: PEP/pyruvate-binding domain-containing protein [Desulfobaccales bacterium]|nr:PEP/pyruvate-binding domain-containing protein [Desulfobaccales bacterium]